MRTIDAILAISIVEVWKVLDLPSLDKTFKCLCPFHNEDSPSMVVGGAKNIAYCHGCGKSFNPFGLVKEVLKLENREVYRWFEQNFGVKPDPKFQKRVKEEKIKLSEATELLPMWNKKFRADLETQKFLKDEYDLDAEFCTDTAQLGIFNHAGYGKGIVYPCFDKDGDLVAVKYRSIARDKDGKRHNLFIAGGGNHYYGIGRINKRDVVIITGGEEKWLKLFSLNYSCISPITGEGKNITQMASEIKEADCQRIVLAFDADETGEAMSYKFAMTLRSISFKNEILKIQWGEGVKKGYDINDASKDGILKSLIQNAKPIDVTSFTGDVLYAGARGGLVQTLAVEMFEALYPFLYHVTGDWYEYRRGCYIIISEAEVKTRIWAMLGKRAKRDDLTNVYELAKMKRFRKLDIWNAEGRKVCVLNGIISLDREFVFAPHNPQICLRRMTHVDFDAGAECQRFYQVLGEILPDKETHRLMQQWFGYCLTDSTLHQCAMLWLGNGSNGKGILSHILTQMLGEENVTHLRMTHLNKDFHLGELSGKLLNIAVESKSSEANVEDVLREAIHADSKIHADVKYDKPFEFKPKAKWIFCLNDPIRTSETSDGFWRSFITINFPVKFYSPGQEFIPPNAPIKDINLYETILDEMPGIFNWAINGYYDLQRTGYFCVPESCRGELANMRMDNNSVHQFTTAKCIIHPDAHDSKGDIYRAYRDYCKETGPLPKALPQFLRELNKLYKGKIDTEYRTGSMRMIKGLELSGEGSESKDDELPFG